MDIVRHHLLEIILWPNEDGTFTEIRNSAKRLTELGIYKDYKLTIVMNRSEHSSMHMKNNNFFEGHRHTDEYKSLMSKKLKGRTSPTKGKKLPPRSKEWCDKLSAAASKKNTGCYWWTNGKDNVFRKECPDGFHRGRTFIPHNKGVYNV